MTLLALDFSSPQRSVAVVRRSSPAAAPPLLDEVVETGAVSTRAFQMIETALRHAGLEREQIESLAIGLGPGSYTGIRAAIAIAQGWQLARGVNLVGVSSADAIAAEAQADGLRGSVAVVLDAQRDEFYLAEYELAPENWRPLTPLRLVTREAVQAAAKANKHLIGPEVTRWFSGGRLVFPRAAVIGRLALGRTDFVSGEKLVPIYLRETTFVKGR